MLIDLTIDTSGTRCPIPLLKAKQALRTLEQGQHLLVISTDPSSVDDFAAMLKHLPHELISSEQQARGSEQQAQGSEQQEHSVEQYRFVIRKG